MARILVLGGTGWLSGSVARRGVAAGHDVTCLARGVGGGFADGATQVRADRDGTDAYGVVEDTAWDVVIDVSSRPGQVRSALDTLAPRAAHWVYVSSGSAYASTDHVTTPGEDVWAPLAEPLAGDSWEDASDYSAAKAACELACRDAVPADRLLVARVGLIGGPGDPSDRFGYWPGRFALAGDGPVLVPDVPTASTQVIDVRDLAVWLLDAGVSGAAGVIDAVGESLPLADALALAARVAGHTGEVRPVAPRALDAARVAHWAGPRSLPLWLPEQGFRALTSQDERGARAAGLSPRPLEETLRDVLADERHRGLSRARGAGLDREDELDVLRALGA